MCLHSCVVYTMIIGAIECNLKIVKWCSFILFVNNDYVFNFKSNNKATKKRNQNMKMNLLFFKVNFIHGRET